MSSEGKRWTTAICDSCGMICGRDSRGRVTFSCSCKRVPATASEIEVVPASEVERLTREKRNIISDQERWRQERDQLRWLLRQADSLVVRHRRQRDKLAEALALILKLGNAQGDSMLDIARAALRDSNVH